MVVCYKGDNREYQESKVTSGLVFMGVGWRLPGGHDNG
jgi:hypothetical protein